MPSERPCSQCGAPLPENAPGGRCPKCLVQLALEESGDGEVDVRTEAVHQPSVDLPGKAIVLSEADRVTERTGKLIGRYKLLQQIGEGGFGVVFMAEQTEPVQRKVALKVIKAGMDTREIIARFEAERQALALMDHPNIAKILDAGVTENPVTGAEGRARHSVRADVGASESGAQGPDAPYLSPGRPYFVMELVRGLPITTYCDQANLSTRERLELFIKVCRAVQHAHQKGVIHRDLKPTNVLVTLHDGEPVPKVIDFGVAKALGQKLTEKTLFTRFEQMIGTPAYMSPEQAALSGLDVDTRSDVYSLGVLLYELLTGVTPLDAETLREAALDEVRRMIQETEPPRPSTRLATLGERLAAVAKCRQADPATLGRLIRGDLDWIAMKALEKDRSRRYETANGLASDVQRFQANEAVLARPPSGLYRLGKLIRRHKLAFAAAGVVTASLVIGFGVSTYLFLQERQARQRAIAAEQAEARLRQEAETARASETRQREQAELNEKKAQEQALRSDQIEGYTAKLFNDVSQAFSMQSDNHRLLEVLDNVAINARKELKSHPFVAATILSRIGAVYLHTASNLKAESMLKEALDLLKELPDRGEPLHSRTLYLYCIALRIQDRHSEAEIFLKQILASTPKPLPSQTNDIRRLCYVWSYLSEIQEEQGELLDAEASLLEWQTLRKSAGDNWFFPGIPRIQERLGKLDEAETQWREYIRSTAAETNYSNWLFDFANLLRRRGKYDEATAVLDRLEGSIRNDDAPISDIKADRQSTLGKAFEELAWDRYKAGEHAKAVQAATRAKQLLRESIQLGMNEANWFRAEKLSEAKGLLGGALVTEAAADLGRSPSERLALLKEAEPLSESLLNGSEFLPDADTNSIHQAMLRRNRLYSVWYELSLSPETAAASAYWEARAAEWVDPTTPYNRMQSLRERRKFGDAEILCRQILEQVRNERSNATPRLARSLFDLAIVLSEQKRHRESVPFLIEALDVLGKCQPAVPMFRERVWNQVNRLSTLMGNSGQRNPGEDEALQELAKLATVEDQRAACSENLGQINGGKVQWALENSKDDNAIPTPKELWGLNGYLPRGEPKCPAGGTYIIGPVKASAKCSVHGSRN